VLELGNQTPVGGAKGPSVTAVDHMVCGDGQERLDCEYEALAKNHPSAIVDARHRGILVEAPADPVPVEVLDHAEPVPTCPLLDGSTQITHASSRPSGVHGVALREFGGFEQP
jgi:hypothetical protein